MTVSTNNYQIGQSAVPNQNFHLTTPAIPDGSLQLYRGNVGAPSGAALISIDATGQISYPTDAAWTQISGSVASSSGALGASPTATIRYKRLGKVLMFHVTVSVPDNGTGAGTLVISGMPFVSGSITQGLGGKNLTSSQGLAVTVTSSAQALVVSKYDGTYPVASGQFLAITGSYEIA